MNHGQTSDSNALREQLTGGDRRSIGRMQEVVERVLMNNGLFPGLMALMEDGDPVVQMRAADAVEKVTARRPELLQTHTSALLTRIGRLPAQEVRWHVAQVIPRLALTPEERSVAVHLLHGYLGDRSRIVRTCAMQALSDLALSDAALRPGVIATLERLTETGSPAMKARGRKLLAQLQR